MIVFFMEQNHAKKSRNPQGLLSNIDYISLKIDITPSPARTYYKLYYNGI